MYGHGGPLKFRPVQLCINCYMFSLCKYCICSLFDLFLFVKKNLIKTFCLQRQACLVLSTFAMVPNDNECTNVSIYEYDEK